MTDKLGARASHQALIASDGAQLHGLHPSGFDPSRISGVCPEDYAQGLLGEEASEVGQALGKARRFGIDTPGPLAAPYFGCTAREMLETECGDMLAAIEWSISAGLIRRDVVTGQRDRKLGKLLSPDSVDNLGRRLAPAIAMEARQRRDAEERPDPKDDSAGRQASPNHPIPTDTPRR